MVVVTYSNGCFDQKNGILEKLRDILHDVRVGRMPTVARTSCVVV